MKVVGSALLGVDRARLWTALQDPGVLVRTIPGCERLEAVGGDIYRMTVHAGVASIRGVYQGEVALADPEEPESFVLRARGQGAPGTVDATVQIRLSEVEGGTRVDYDADAVVGGMIGGVGQRMLNSVARKTAGEFFSAVEEHLLAGPILVETAGPVPALAEFPTFSQAPAFPEAPAFQEAPAFAEAAPLPAPPAAQPGQVFTRPAPPPKPAAPSWSLLAAFGMGAAIALGSAVIGWLLGRSRR